MILIPINDPGSPKLQTDLSLLMKLCYYTFEESVLLGHKASPVSRSPLKNSVCISFLFVS